ncbi:hypothetical protein DIPPA_00332 [Diplonema papillatum]|nr:hypothetical protein DIPPA_00332 [Diplonema papillatum]
MACGMVEEAGLPYDPAQRMAHDTEDSLTGQLSVADTSSLSRPTVSALSSRASHCFEESKSTRSKDRESTGLSPRSSSDSQASAPKRKLFQRRMTLVVETDEGKLQALQGHVIKQESFAEREAEARRRIFSDYLKVMRILKSNCNADVADPEASFCLAPISSVRREREDCCSIC